MDLSIVMPRLSDSMEEGTIIEWLKQEGEYLEVGEELAEIESDKSTMVYEADTAGWIVKFLLQPGQSAPVGETIVQLSKEKEAKQSEANKPEKEIPEEEKPEKEIPEEEKPEEKPVLGQARNPLYHKKASPLAKRIAKSHGVDIAEISGTGPGYRVVKADVEKYIAEHGSISAETIKEAPVQETEVSAETIEEAPVQETEVSVTEVAGEIIPLTSIEKITAKRLQESKSTIPHYYLERDVRMDAIVEGRKKIKKLGLPVPSINDFFLKAVAIALEKYPRLGGEWSDNGIRVGRSGVGMAVAGPKGLVVPVIKNARSLSLGRIKEESQRLQEAVASGKIAPADLEGAAITVSNLGMYGIRSFSAVINPGQAAILAIGGIREEIYLEVEEIKQKQLTTLTLSLDHRIVDGALGAEFLAYLGQVLEDPMLLAF